jgi:hypothetical protein
VAEELGCDVVDRRKTNALAVDDHSKLTEVPRSGRLKHTGDPGLTQHVLNAVARVLPQKRCPLRPARRLAKRPGTQLEAAEAG